MKGPQNLVRRSVTFAVHANLCQENVKKMESRSQPCCLTVSEKRMVY
jgi:hypothetical protein